MSTPYQPNQSTSISIASTSKSLLLAPGDYPRDTSKKVRYADNTAQPRNWPERQLSSEQNSYRYQEPRERLGGDRYGRRGKRIQDSGNGGLSEQQKQQQQQQQQDHGLKYPNGEMSGIVRGPKEEQTGHGKRVFSVSDVQPRDKESHDKYIALCRKRYGCGYRIHFGFDASPEEEEVGEAAGAGEGEGNATEAEEIEGKVEVQEVEDIHQEQERAACPPPDYPPPACPPQDQDESTTQSFDSADFPYWQNDLHRERWQHELVREVVHLKYQLLDETQGPLLRQARDLLRAEKVELWFRFKELELTQKMHRAKQTLKGLEEKVKEKTKKAERVV
ncbi:uncharacterized protein F4812DRAFT_111135 [Daldinia caldariorum]|uniref:uncharacterized protein n=1 Tax=Daldinia caldariorum TaxID=326644 RepID=UPI002008E566|nr:uncharacterized protein F4812DRAFT_111135 [Daldinia caldariorum]KAI1465761.1 hypothetical protein F4812DRAFT_111135 [Daldinia caldariorum]